VDEVATQVKVPGLAEEYTRTLNAAPGIMELLS
jgi:hypothetical protein